MKLRLRIVLTVLILTLTFLTGLFLNPRNIPIVKTLKSLNTDHPPPLLVVEIAQKDYSQLEIPVTIPESHGLNRGELVLSNIGVKLGIVRRNIAQRTVPYEIVSGLKKRIPRVYK